MSKNTIVNAAILIIGNEILSGRTQDTNTSTLATWLNSIGVKNSNKRDYLLILLSGFLGGLVGGYLSNEIQIPDNIWYLSEFLKLVFAVFSMHGLQFIFKKTGFRK